MLLLLSVPFRLAILRRLISACLRPVVSEASTEVGPAGQAQTDEADLSRLGRASGFHSGFVRTDTDAAKMAWHLHSVLNQGCSADSGGSRNHVQSTSRACKERVSNVSMLERYLGVEALFFSWLTKECLSGPFGLGIGHTWPQYTTSQPLKNLHSPYRHYSNYRTQQCSHTWCRLSGLESEPREPPRAIQVSDGDHGPRLEVTKS